MPTIRRFANCKIAIYADDHLPAHFHIERRGFRAVFALETMEIRAGSARKATEALAWAAKNQDLLMAAWLRLNQRG